MQKQIFSDRLLKAVKTTSRLFEGAKRKDGYDYSIHLFGVMYIAAQFTDDEDIIIAALMHDTLEDIDPNIYSELNLRQDFGDRVAELVKTVSHFETEEISKKESREIYLQNITNGPKNAIIITASDLINNLMDMISVLDAKTIDANDTFVNVNDKNFKIRFWFYGERVRIINERLGADHPLTKEVKSTFNRYKKLIENY